MGWHRTVCLGLLSALGAGLIGVLAYGAYLGNCFGHQLVTGSCVALFHTLWAGACVILEFYVIPTSNPLLGAIAAVVACMYIMSLIASYVIGGINHEDCGGQILLTYAISGTIAIVISIAIVSIVLCWVLSKMHDCPEHMGVKN